MIEFKHFAKIPRWSDEITITEKLDGTNACVIIDEDGSIGAQSRSRLLEVSENPQNDNHGFGKWVWENQKELLKLGKGHHYGEWYGKGINLNYGLKERRFALFNTNRWNNENKPECCEVVPILYSGRNITGVIEQFVGYLTSHGSVAAPGFMQPEGLMIFHHKAGQFFKKLIEGDLTHKSENKNESI
ncbi:MAG: RNA ligase family protein [Patescibacteria group bacterium]